LTLRSHLAQLYAMKTSKKVSLILAHPSPSSFNHAIADVVAARLRAAGCDVSQHDLYAEKFDPVFTADELARDPVLPPEIEAHCREAAEADAFVFVHPNWWSQVPAILRGWQDRVLRAGRAYRFVPDGKGGGRPEGLLRARAVLVITTANTPQEKEAALLGDPLDVHWRKAVFGLCGVKDVRRLVFSPVITSTEEQRAGWLEESARAAEKLCDTPDAACISIP
jgi:NAD(P)H dehydrogenase (quinone)